MTVAAVPLWAGQAIVIAVAVVWVAVLILGLALCRAAALGDRDVLPPDGMDARRTRGGPLPPSGLPRRAVLDDRPLLTLIDRERTHD